MLSDKNDPLAMRVEQQNRLIDSLRRELDGLRHKKDIPPKRARSLDRQSYSRLSNDVGKPGVVAGGIIYTIGKVCDEAGGKPAYVWDWVMSDTTFNGWISAAMIVMVAAIWKYFQKF